MGEKATFEEAKDRSSRAARVRRRRLFMQGVAAGSVFAILLVVSVLAAWPEPERSPWVGIGESQPKPFDLVLVARADGEWTVAYLNDSYEFITPCDGHRVRGVVRWMQAPERP